MFKSLVLIVVVCPVIASCSDKPVVGPFLSGPYANVNFDMNEATLTTMHPEVVCRQMPNPVVRMCHGKGSEGEDVSFLFYSGKLININGKTRD